MRIRQILGAAAGGLLLAVALPVGSAHAVTGSLTWQPLRSTHEHVVRHPRSWSCVNLGRQGHRVRNGTDKGVVLFRDRGCRGVWYHLPAGRRAPSGVRVTSVLFGG